MDEGRSGTLLASLIVFCATAALEERERLRDRAETFVALRTKSQADWFRRGRDGLDITREVHP